MNGKSHTIQRTLRAVALTASVAAVAVPSAFAGNSGGPGIVPSKLGSPDPREANGNVNSAGLVPSRLGSQDPRDTASQASGSQSSIVASRLGSQDPRDTASQVIAESSVVARELGTPDTRDAALQANDGDFMFRDNFRGTHFGNLEIGIVGAVCGLLLLTALGIGARQVRHTRHRLGSA